jgi:phosphopantothenoylcysteine synthetase/decarboxylase
VSAFPRQTKPVVVVGVTGSIAAYKSADLVSRLVKERCEVHVAMTHAAQQFVTALTFQTLSRNPVVTNGFDNPGWKPGHVDLADRADCF